MRTTININYDVLERLKDSSEVLDLSSHDLIAMLMNIVISKNNLCATSFKGVRYQDDDPGKNWCKHHVWFDHQVYELGLDFRKFFKVSVSLLISFAIVNFLDELVEKMLNSNLNNCMVDNYPANYITIAKMFDDIKGFIVLWGIPEEEKLKILIP